MTEYTIHKECLSLVLLRILYLRMCQVHMYVKFITDVSNSWEGIFFPSDHLLFTDGRNCTSKKTRMIAQGVNIASKGPRI